MLLKFTLLPCQAMVQDCPDLKATPSQGPAEATWFSDVGSGDDHQITNTLNKAIHLSNLFPIQEPFFHVSLKKKKKNPNELHLFLPVSGVPQKCSKKVLRVI